MKQSLHSIVLLLLSVTLCFGSPFSPVENHEDEDEDCFMEWIIVSGDDRVADLAGAPPGAGNTLTGQLGLTAGTPISSSTSVAAYRDGASSSLAPDDSYMASTPIPSSTYATPSVASVSSSPVAPSSSAVSSAPTNTLGSSSLTPGGKKAGISGFEGVTTQSGWSQFAHVISWYSDYTPDPADSGSVKGIGMLWGDGSQGSQDASRLATFTSTVATANPAPQYMMGFYEPDWTPPDSSSIDPPTAAAKWAQYLPPLGARGTKLGSPSLAKQMDETWLTPFSDASQHPTWDYTCIHANKNSSTLVAADVEYYYNKYKKPVWVSEFSCMNDLEWTLCEDPTTFIQETVKYLEGSDMVVAYGYSNGDGLPESWKIFDAGGGLSANGKTYLAALGG